MAVMTKRFIEGCIPEELMKLLLSLASNSGDVIDTNTMKVVLLTGAMTNEIYKISWPTKIEDDLRTVLVRIYGKSAQLFYNRDEEIRTFEGISMHGQGPRLLGQFPEGRVEEFIHARTLSASDLRDMKISARIAAKMREFHNLDISGSKSVILWDRTRNWLNEAKSLCSPEHAKEFCLDVLENEINMLEKELPKDYQEIGFCHNDLQYANIMIDDKTGSITFIDYEYSGYNPVAYDLANHFCEMVGNYDSDTPHILDYSIYPDLEERQRFVRIYLSSSGHESSDSEVEKLVNDAEKYTLANHLCWGLNAIISSYVINSNVDYIEYARQRFQQYWLRKPQLLDISLDDGVNNFADFIT